MRDIKYFSFYFIIFFFLEYIWVLLHAIQCYIPVTSVQARKIMANVEYADPNRGGYDGSFRKPDIRSGHCGVYLCCDGTTVI